MSVASHWICIRRFVTWLDSEVQRRKIVQFSQPGKPLPWIVVIIDGWEHFENRSDPNFVETSLLGTMRGIITAGTQFGIHVVAIGGQDMMSGKLPALYSERILLPFPKEDVRRQHLSSGMVSPPVLPGRAIDASIGHHIQFARPSLPPQELIHRITQQQGHVKFTDCVALMTSSDAPWNGEPP
ncbi:MAG: hypothetical protein ACT4NY_24125 [Pseudonocardiales bacterium]